MHGLPNKTIFYANEEESVKDLRKVSYQWEAQGTNRYIWKGMVEELQHFVQAIADLLSGGGKYSREQC